MTSSDVMVQKVGNNTQDERIITSKDITMLNWRSLMGACSCNYERLTHKPFCFMVGPCLKKIYKDDKKEYSQALQRHLVWYNTTPQVYSWFAGLMVSLEERRKKEADFDPAMINAVKSSLMGPMSGIFDSIFISTIRVIGASIAIALATQGNIIAPLIYFLVYNIPNMICRFYGGHLGYRMGTDMLTKLQKSGLMDTILEAASIMGLMVVGSMCYSYISVNLALTWGPAGYETTLMSVLNGIFPGILNLGAVFLFYWLYKKGINTLILIFGTIITCGLFVALGIM
jgi:fructoselysine and glucoselysine-specific PTS system IID component